MCYRVTRQQDIINRILDRINASTVNFNLLPGKNAMDSQEFVDIRKKLEKTQKELATLMGISLKAVCSYEQGWRSIPGHAQRQLIFLLAKKFSMSGQPANCWDIRKCPEEKVKRCPAYEFNAGNLCWFIGGTNCCNTAHVSWEKKMETCKKCEVMQDVPL